MRAKRVAVLLFLVAALCGNRLFAHPMGNFSVNHYAKITLRNDRVSIRYLIDLAEIPTFQELQQGGIEARAGDVAVTKFVAARGEDLARGLELTVDGKWLPLHMDTSEVIFPPGAGGLPTMKMGFVYEAMLPAGIDRANVSLRYADGNYEGHSGWKEVVAIAETGTLTRSSAPPTDRSAELSNYPADLLNAAPQVLGAEIEAALPPLPATPKAAATAAPMRRATANEPAAHAGKVSASHRPPASPAREAIANTVLAPAPAALVANRQQTPRSRFTELIAAQHLSLWFLFTAAIIAMGLGALHALEPGHGKTIVAAYLVGSRGTARHAALLGLIVTASHTAGVFALGAITLYASRYIVPEQLYPWLGVLSGLTIAVLGIYMLLRRLTGTASDHSHDPGSGHAHWPFARRDAEEAATPERMQLGLGQLFTLGITGGIIPCPAALIVLLSALALHRVALGFFLIVAFSAGLAAVLIAFGMVMVHAGRLMTRLKVDGPLTKRWLPAASAAFITALGAALTVQAFAQMHHAIHFSLSPERVGPFLFVVGLGLVLGMRHSTDPDHVVAISTIVSKQKGLRNAALIGSVWGLGHTITVFAVGALIILFGVQIPPRIGLSLEFSVAVMLVLLGMMNLTGLMQRVTTRLSPRESSSAAESNGQQQSMQILRGPFAQSIARLGVFQLLRPLCIGLVHGLAGSAAVALLALSTIHDPVWATAYLLIFGAGTLVGMMLMTTAISLPLSFAGARSATLSRYFGFASGMASLCFGSFLVYQLGFLGGLFTAHPHWTPQ